jgi:hypothetical protein
MHRLFLVLAFTGTFSLSAHAAGNARAGKMLAERWCASCHLVHQSKHELLPMFQAFDQLRRIQRNSNGWRASWLILIHLCPI